MMASISRRVILQNIRMPFIFKSYICSSPYLNNKWRISQNLEPNPYDYGPLNYLPDYSFVDGRPVPISRNQAKKIKLHQEFCKTIAELSQEMDTAVEYYEKKLQVDAEERQKLLNKKFKPKGNSLKKFNKNLT